MVLNALKYGYIVLLFACLMWVQNCGNPRGRQEVPTSSDGASDTEKISSSEPSTPEPPIGTEPSARPEPPVVRESVTPAEPPVGGPDAGPIAEQPIIPEPTKEAAPPEPPPTGNACQSVAPMKPGDTRWQLKHDGVTREYYVNIPPQYTGKTKLPVVLNFHGLNSNATQQKLWASLNTLANKEGFISIHAEGRGIPQSWNGGLCCSPASSVLKAKDVDFVRAMLDDLERKLCIDSKRVYATGISNGAYISYRLACDLSDRIAAIAPVAGIMLSSPCKPQRPLSVIAFHGTADAIVPFNGNKLIGWPSVQDGIDFWVKQNGCSTTPKEVYKKGDTTCNEYTGCKDNTRVRLCVVSGGGHTWPGGFPIPGLGKTTNDIKATDALWEFMRQHQLP